MLDRPIAPDATLSGSPQRAIPRWPCTFLGLAGLMGASGVAVGAAGAHGGGGDLARTSSEFLLVHAAAVVAGSGAGLALTRTPISLIIALGLLTVGGSLFGGELALAALVDWRPVPLAAPAGGLCLVAGWLCLSMSGAALGLRRRRDGGSVAVRP